MSILTNKLRAIKKELKVWNHTIFANVLHKAQTTITPIQQEKYYF